MEAFFNLKRRQTKKMNYLAVSPCQLETIQISTLACWLLISQIFDKKKVQTIRQPGVDFNVMTIDKRNPLRDFIDSLLIDYDIEIARIYEFFPRQKNSALAKNLFSNRDAIIIRLNEGDTRLKIGSKLVSESPGKGYVMPSDIRHEIIEGEDVRYSLVLWGNKKFNIRQNTIK